MEILKVLVGSRAHGLAMEESDTDYRGVYVTPTSELLTLGTGGYKGTSWTEGDTEDNTAYELAHFLHLATKSNPSILEVFAAPVVEAAEAGTVLRNLFPHVWSSHGVLKAFIGYSLNQRKKMLDDKYEFRQRRWKYAAAYIRTLIQGIGLLRTGRLDVRVPIQHIEMITKIRDGKRSVGQIIDLADRFTTVIYQEYENNPRHDTNLDPINEFLLRVRKAAW